jgi:hypothetical protein
MFEENFEFWKKTVYKLFKDWLDKLLLPKSLFLRIFMIGDCIPKSLLYALDKLISSKDLIDITLEESLPQAPSPFSLKNYLTSFLSQPTRSKEPHFIETYLIDKT